MDDQAVQRGVETARSDDERFQSRVGREAGIEQLAVGRGSDGGSAQGPPQREALSNARQQD